MRLSDLRLLSCAVCWRAVWLLLFGLACHGAFLSAAEDLIIVLSVLSSQDQATVWQGQRVPLRLYVLTRSEARQNPRLGNLSAAGGLLVPSQAALPIVRNNRRY